MLTEDEDEALVCRGRFEFVGVSGDSAYAEYG